MKDNWHIYLRQGLGVFIFGFCLVSNLSCRQVAACAGCSLDAEELVQQIKSMNFNCDFLPVSLSRAYRCQGRVEDYPEPIDIFISAKYQRNQPLLLAYHFHGWWTNPNETPFDGEDGDFGRFVAESASNMILVLPESHGRNDSFENHLNTVNKMNQFLIQVENILFNTNAFNFNLIRRALSGHSGAYVQLARVGEWIFNHQLPLLENVNAFALLDSAYGYRPGLSLVARNLCQKNQASYVLAYNPTDGADEKRRTNQQLYKELVDLNCAKLQVVYQPNSQAQHKDFPRLYLPDFFASAAGQ